jgi:hypothetical protein
MMAMEAIHSVAPAEAGAAMLQRESRAASGPGLRRGDVE